MTHKMTYELELTKAQMQDNWGTQRPKYRPANIVKWKIRRKIFIQAKNRKKS